MSATTVEARSARLLPGGIPRYVRCYDNGGATCDRYSIVFTGRYRHKTGGEFWDVSASALPTHPQGFYQHGGSERPIDRPTSGHLGRRIPFAALPESVRACVLADYRDLWDLEGVTA